MFRGSGGTLLTGAGVAAPPFDAFSMALSVGNTVETYSFFQHGLSGTKVSQWVLTYTDNTRAVLVSGVFTDLSS